MNGFERLAYSPDDFKAIQGLVSEHAGINLRDGKQELVYSRLAKRVRKLGFNNFRDYCHHLAGDEEEILHCINSMTTNVTSFFREGHHFEFLAGEVLHNATSKVRVWSAGCSTGEEPYSIAFTASASPAQVEITATDLDTHVLQHASNGVYRLKDVAGLEQASLKKWFLRGKGSRQGQVRVNRQFRDMVNFSRLNLKEAWTWPEPFDVIFCRNVMIYFDHELRSRLIERFHQHLKPGGYLILGHSESLFGLSNRFRVVGKTIHRKEDS